MGNLAADAFGEALAWLFARPADQPDQGRDLVVGGAPAGLVLGEDVVEWRDFGWQTDYEPFDTDGNRVRVGALTGRPGTGYTYSDDSH